MKKKVYHIAYAAKFFWRGNEEVVKVSREHSHNHTYHNITASTRERLNKIQENSGSVEFQLDDDYYDFSVSMCF